MDFFNKVFVIYFSALPLSTYTLLKKPRKKSKESIKKSRKNQKLKKSRMLFFQAEDGIRDAQESRGLGDVYKRQGSKFRRSRDKFRVKHSKKRRTRCF